MKQEKKVNTYKDDYVYESCYICGRNMYKASQIFVDIKNDHYICGLCKKKHNIKTVKCRDLD